MDDLKLDDSATYVGPKSLAQVFRNHKEGHHSSSTTKFGLTVHSLR